MSIEIKISKKPISYKRAMLFLNKRVEEVKNRKKRELLWILEHPITYTAGVRFNKKEILDKKIQIKIEQKLFMELQTTEYFMRLILEMVQNCGALYLHQLFQNFHL